MKLSDYFKNQKYKLADDDKFLIFNDIKTAIDRKSIFSKFSFYMRVWVYSLFLFFIFWGLFLNFNKKISDNIKLETNSNIVQASYIWKVIKSKWNFEIYDNNKKLDTNIINNWNTIVLQNNSYVKVKINEGVQMYLLWPAKLKIYAKNTFWKTSYIMNVIDGDYITIKSNSKKDKIILKSKFLNIESNDKNIDIKYKKQWWVDVVENNWWEIIVKNRNKTITLSNKEKAIILSDNDKKYIKDLFDDYKKYQISTNGDVKVVLSTRQIKKIWTILNRENMILAVWKLVLWKFNNNTKLRIEWELQVKYIVVNLYNFFEKDNAIVDITKLSLKDTENIIKRMLFELNKKYVLPDIYITRLKVLLSYIYIVDMAKIKNEQKFNTLSDVINYLKLDDKYKKVLLNF